MASYVVLRLAPRALQRGVSSLTKQSMFKQCGVVIMKKSNFSLWNNKNNSTSVAGKSEYEIELEKIVKKEKYERYHGFFQHDPLFDKALMNLWFFAIFSTTTFVVLMFAYAPDFKSQMREWKKREAIRLIEQRQAAGEFLINPDFCPPDLIANMVPEEGDWEEQWLRDQPALFTDSRPTYYAMVDTN